jgi:hypothetical protein
MLCERAVSRTVVGQAPVAIYWGGEHMATPIPEPSAIHPREIMAARTSSLVV